VCSIPPGYQYSPIRTPYAAIVLAQPPLQDFRNGHVMVTGSIWLGQSVVQLECEPPDGPRGMVPVSVVYDPGEHPEVIVLPLKRAAVPAPAGGDVA
jgi:hypothetical protein